MRHLPLRLTLIIGIALLALGETVLLFVSANTYRDLAYDNHRQALAELIGASVGNQLQTLEENALDFAKTLQSREIVRASVRSGNTDSVIELLDNQFHQYFTTGGLGEIQKLFVLSEQLELVASSREGLALAHSGDLVCPQLIEIAVAREGNERLKSLTRLCAYQGRAHMAVLVPIGSFRPRGYVLMIVNPAFNVRAVADNLGIPLSVVHPGGVEEFHSEHWPTGSMASQYLVADYVLTDDQGNELMRIHAARDIEPFRARVQQTTWVVVIIAALISGPLFIAAFVVFDRMAGRTTGLIASLEKEVAERKHAEQALLAAKQEADNANQAKSQFLANMSHEIRTPMNAILGYAQILDRDETVDAKHRRIVNIILRSGHHLLDIINEILDLSKIEAGRVELNEMVFDLGALVRDIGSMFELRCMQKGLVWQASAPQQAAGLWVRGDQGKLKQILINLLGNAVKFTENGHISLTVREDAPGQFLFEVVDTGPGIRPEQQERIFESFFQADYGRKMGGTGLGLAISRRYVELMGGNLRIRSFPGMGATFYFNIPLARESVATQASKSADVTSAYDWAGIGALVIDDDEANRDVLAQLLHQAGLWVDQADSVEAGLASMENRRPKVVYLDSRLSDDDGLDAVARIRRYFGKELVIIMLTASTFFRDVQRFVDGGCSAVVIKPIDIRELLPLTAKLLQLAPKAVNSRIAQEPEDEFEINLDVLPYETVDRLREYAELGLISEVRSALDELAESSGEGKRLARRLRQAAENYDLDQLVDLLTREHEV